jgi:hypothetical protein
VIILHLPSGPWLIACTQFDWSQRPYDVRLGISRPWPMCMASDSECSCVCICSTHRQTCASSPTSPSHSALTILLSYKIGQGLAFAESPQPMTNSCLGYCVPSIAGAGNPMGVPVTRVGTGLGKKLNPSRLVGFFSGHVLCLQV